MPNEECDALGPSSPVPPKRLLSKAELSQQLGVGVRTIESWMAQRRIPFLRLSARLVKFDLDNVVAALSRYEVKELGRER